MTMQSSGTITMAQINTEYGLGYAMNSHYGRSRGLPTSGAISFNDFYGENAFATVTIGSWQVFGSWSYGYLGGTAGGISDLGIFPGNNGNVAVTRCFWNDTNYIQFGVSKTGVYANANTTFYSLHIWGSTPLLRSSASYNSDASNAWWTWTGQTNKIGTSGTRVIGLRMS